MNIDIKQEMIRINNTVNISMFGNGLRKQRVVVVDDKIIISADHKRVPVLAALDSHERLATRFMDVTILDAYKRKLKEEIEAQLNIPVKSVLKDYDPVCELAVTIIVLDQSVIKEGKDKKKE